MYSYLLHQESIYSLGYIRYQGSLSKKSLFQFCNSFAIIPICFKTWKMLAKCPCERWIKVRIKKEKFAVMRTFRRTPKVWSFVVRLFAEDGKEMYLNVKRTCRRLFLLMKPFSFGCWIVTQRFPTYVTYQHTKSGGDTTYTQFTSTKHA